MPSRSVFTTAAMKVTNDVIYPLDEDTPAERKGIGCSLIIRPCGSHWWRSPPSCQRASSKLLDALKWRPFKRKSIAVFCLFPEKLYVVHSEYAVISTSLGLRVEMLPVSSCACEIAAGLRNAELKMFKAFSLKRRSVNETKRLQSESWKVNVDTT